MGPGEVCGGVLPIPAEIVDCDGYGYRWEGLKNKSYYRSSHCYMYETVRDQAQRRLHNNNTALRQYCWSHHLLPNLRAYRK